MRIVNLNKLSDFGEEHADARKNLFTWQDVAEKTSLKNRQDVLADFSNAKMIKNSRAGFEIKHITYRLIVYTGYDAQTVVIRFIGTPTEYDRIDPEII